MLSALDTTWRGSYPFKREHRLTERSFSNFICHLIYPLEDKTMGYNVVVDAESIFFQPVRFVTICDKKHL